VPSEHVQYVKSVLGPDAITVVPRAGHSIHRENPSFFVSSILDWIDARAEL
jgi:hypothetical protein